MNEDKPAKKGRKKDPGRTVVLTKWHEVEDGIAAGLKRIADLKAEIALQRGMVETLQAHRRKIKRNGGRGAPDARIKGDRSIRELVLEILRDRDGPMTAREILKELADRHGLDVERTTLSSILSKLKKSNRIRREGIRNWRIVPKLK